MKKVLSDVLMILMAVSLAAISCKKTEDNKAGELLTVAALPYLNIPACTQGDLYYEITLDYTSGKTYYQMGQEYANLILQKVPTYEKIIDAYLYTWTLRVSFSKMLTRTNDIKSQIPADIDQEIQGVASVLATAATDVPGDGKLSLTELYMLSILPDIVIGGCSAVSVFGDLSQTGSPIVGRNLDWFGGTPYNILSQVQAVVTRKYSLASGKKSLCTIGYLGHAGVITGINSSKVFAAILVSPTPTYESAGRRLYNLDLRSALESCDSVDAAGNYMIDPSRVYAASHNLMLADATTSKVVENNPMTGGIRALRTDISVLNNNIAWGIANAVGVVNSYVLKDNYDNHTGSAYTFNSARWEAMKTQLNAKIAAKGKLGAQEVKEVIGFNNGDGPGNPVTGDLYMSGNVQTIIIQPATLTMDVFFYPRCGSLPLTQTFQTIPINF